MDSVRATLMRIFVDESDRRGARPLYEAIVETLRERGFPGATVLKGIEGFGSRRQVRTARAVDYSSNLPVLIEVAEEEERVRDALPELVAMIPGGLITLEKIVMQPVRSQA